MNSRAAWLLRVVACTTAIAVVLAGPASSQPAPRGGDVAGVGVGDDGPGPEEALTQKIAVWRIDALGMPPELVARLETLFRMELDRLATRPLPTRRELDKVIAGSRDLTACAGEDRCVADIGKRLGVDVMVVGSVAALGDSYTLNIKAVEVASGKQIRRITTDPLRGSPDELIEAIRVAAYRLLAPDQLHGGVVILTDLVGAEVSMDGAVVGKTPLAAPLGRLALGPHTLKVAAAGYVPFEDKVEVRFQKTTRVVVRLVTQAVDGSVGGPVTSRDVRTGSRGHWYTSPWMFVAVGAAAILVGGAIGYGAGHQGVVDCSGASPPAVCK